MNGGKGGSTTPMQNASAAASSTGLVSTTSRGEGPDRARSPPPSLTAGPRAAVQDFAQQSVSLCHLALPGWWLTASIYS